MAKQLNINLGFTADTSQAKAQVQSLQMQLSGLLNSTNGSSFGAKITGDIAQASQAIAELKMHLQNATNVNTGNLDFTKLNESVTKSGMSLQQYGDKLRSLGPAGQQAFNTLASSVAQAEVPIRRSNALLTELWTTLKNTARWQISSSILHGFMSSVQGAYRYAQDLNRSLNDIRIVTGQSVDEMAQFAEQANRSAKALSTTTTEYTKASLIYYQQGLNDQQVKERTDVTVKMANVSRQSAEVVSDQMTAIWNNFDDGSKSLEHYADVLTALGAKTASSTDEIAGGLEKFAGVADTIGLSYEYAAAALATITSNTRQSEEVVGTALKTIFARIQGLKLGDTLEDGTDLNKYSEALQKVGISIFDQAGQLKNMDTILDEMGSKWQTLNKDQQVALAQTVAGVRQYTQLVSLMDNWDSGDNDSFQTNLQTANSATGELNKQQDIYAESWEAASNRVKAATQGIYDNLIDDEGFIHLLNTIADIIGYFDNLIETIGGLQGVLTTLGAVLTKVFASQISQGITNMAYSLKMMTKAGRESVQQQKTQFINDAVASIDGSMEENAPNESKARQAGLRDQLTLQQQMIDNSAKMSEGERQVNQILMDRHRILSEEAAMRAKEVDQAKNAQSDVSMAARTDIAATAMDNGYTDEMIKGMNRQYTDLSAHLSNVIKLEVDVSDLAQADMEAEEFKQSLQEIRAQAETLDDNVDLMKIIDQLEKGELSTEDFAAEVGRLKAELRGMREAAQFDMHNDLGVQIETAEALGDAYENEVKAAKKASKATKDAEKARDAAAKSIKNAKGAQKDWSDHLVKGANATMSLISSIQMLHGAFKTISNPNMSGWEKFLSITSAVAMAIPLMINGFSGLTTILGMFNGVQTIANGIVQKRIALGNMELATLTAEQLAQQTGMSLDQAEIALSQMKVGAKLAESGAANTLIASMTAEQIAEALGITTDEAAVLASGAKTGATLAEAAAEAGLTATEVGLTAAKSGGVIATIAQTVANWGLMASFPPLLVVALLLVAAIAAIVAIIWVCVKAFQAFQANTPEGKLKTAQEEAEKASEAFDRVTESVNETNEALSRLDSAIASLSGLTAGTDEWLAKVKEINSEILLLLDKFPELSQYITETNGVLGISQEGRDYLTQEMNERTATAYNIKLNKQKDVYEAENKVARQEENIKLSNTNVSDGAVKKDAMFGIMEHYYNELGEGFFTDAGAEMMARAMRPGGDSGSDAVTYTAFDDMDPEGQAALIKDVKETMELNKDAVIEVANRQKQIDLIDDAQLKNKMQSLGSNRTVEQAKELLGEDGYSGILEDSRAKVAGAVDDGGFGDWNDHINYSESDAEWGKIQDFMDLQGDNVEYVAQRWGKMVLKVDGEEIEYSKDEVYDALAELYSTDELKSQLQTKLSETLGAALGNVDLSGVETDDLIQLDNFNLQMQDLMGEDSGNAFTASLLESIVQTTEGINSYSDAIALLGEKTNSIDWSSTDNIREINQAALDLESGKITVEEFTSALAELNAQGALDNMGGYFSAKAEEFGLGEEAAAEMQEYAKHLADVADESGQLSDELGENADSAADLAVEVTRMNKGIDTLADNIDEWSSVLKKSSKTSAEYAKAMSGMKKAVSDVLDVEEDMLSNDFITKNMADIEAAANGNAEAIDRLRSKMDEEIILKVSAGQTDAVKQKITELDTQIHDMAANLPDIEVGAILDDAAFLEAANNLVETSGMTADEANAYFAGIGYEPMYSTEDVEAPGALDINTRNTSYLDNFSLFNGTQTLDLGPLGSYSIPKINPNITWHTETTKLPATDIESTMPLTSFSGDGKPPKIKGMRKKGNGSMNNYSGQNSGGKSPGSGGGGGGGGGDSKPAKKSALTKKADIVDRYKEIGDKIKTVSDKMSDASKEADKLWGPNRLKAMAQVRNALSEEIGLQQQYKQEIIDNLAIDKKAMTDYMSALGEDGLGDFGLQFTFDENGFITNYTEVMTSLHTELNRLETEKNGLATEEEQSDYDESTLAPFKEKVEKIKELIGDYDSTNQMLIDKDNEIQDKINELQTMNYEEITYKVEFKVEMKDAELERVDYYMNKLDGDFFKSAERALLFGDKIAPITEKLSTYYNMVDELQTKFEANEISQADYIAGLQEAQSEMISNVETLKDLLQEVGEYYLNTLSTVNERIDTQTAKFDHYLATIEHYKNLSTMLYGEQAYDKLNNILKGQEKILTNRISVSEREIQMLEGQRDQILAEMNKSGISEQTKQKLQEDLNEIETQIMDKEENMMSDIEQLGEIAMETLTNTLGAARKKFEETLAGTGSSIDSVIAQIERLNSVQEGYLTTTNKMYETNKLISQAQLDMDKTNNTRAKQQLADYIEYIEQLQKSGELSEFELQIAQADYDILQKKIALEEAQEAKNQVRLTRDSEGNYGYVYTANQDDIAKAEQELADAQNARYNTALEAAQNYQDQFYQAEADLLSALEELDDQYANRLISKEEWEARRAEIVDTYLTKAKQAEDLYYKATGVMMEESTTGRLDYTLKGVGSLEELTEATETLMGDQEDAFEDYDKTMGTVADHSEDNFGDIEDGIEDTTEASQDLADELVDNLIPTLENELSDTLETTMEQWYDLEEAINAATLAVEGYLEAIGENTEKNAPVDDYSKEIEKLVASGEDFNDKQVQDLLAQRWKKMGGKDNYNYQSMMDDYLANGGSKDDAWYKTLEILREYKVMMTDWSAVGTDWANDIREEKLGWDYAQKIIDYMKNPQAHWSDDYVQNLLSIRQTKIDEQNLAGQVESNAELKKKVAEAVGREMAEMRTGGYTGAWGPEGKLAVLHEKELVLNAQDTENFLGGIAVLREISQMLDNNALVASLGMLNLRAMTVNSEADKVLQQEVTIHADFPNVTDHNEIEIAIDNLINAASQHAYRR